MYSLISLKMKREFNDRQGGILGIYNEFRLAKQALEKYCEHTIDGFSEMDDYTQYKQQSEFDIEKCIIYDCEKNEKLPAETIIYGAVLEDDHSSIFRGLLYRDFDTAKSYNYYRTAYKYAIFQVNKTYCDKAMTVYKQLKEISTFQDEKMFLGS